MQHDQTDPDHRRITEAESKPRSNEQKHGASAAIAQIGNATIAVSDEQFGNGYTVGYLRYLLDYAGKLLSEREIYEFVMGHLQDVRETDRWNVGVVMGWIAAMHKTRERAGADTSSSQGKEQER